MKFKIVKFLKEQRNIAVLKMLRKTNSTIQKIQLTPLCLILPFIYLLSNYSNLKFRILSNELQAFYILILK